MLYFHLLFAHCSFWSERNTLHNVLLRQNWMHLRCSIGQCGHPIASYMKVLRRAPASVTDHFPLLSPDHTNHADHSLSPNDRHVTSQKFHTHNNRLVSECYINASVLSLNVVSTFCITDWALSVTHCRSYTIHLSSWFWCGNCTGGTQCNHHRTMLGVGSRQTWILCDASTILRAYITALFPETIAYLLICKHWISNITLEMELFNPYVDALVQFKALDREVASSAIWDQFSFNWFEWICCFCKYSRVRVVFSLKYIFSCHAVFDRLLSESSAASNCIQYEAAHNIYRYRRHSNNGFPASRDTVSSGVIHVVIKYIWCQ